jgi:uncharacterized membrane protein YhhN
MPTLALFYISTSKIFCITIVLALFFSWCGDILLIKAKKLRLYTGILCFLTAHILYVLMFIDLAAKFNILAFIFSTLLILSIECFLMSKLHTLNNYKFPIIIYGIAIGLLVIFSLQVFIWYRSIVSTLLVVGSISFFVSDSILIYFNTIKIMTKNALTIIMLSYVIAQACIVVGYVNI